MARPPSSDFRRPAGFVLALGVEILLLLVILSLGTSIGQGDGKKPGLTTVSFRAASEEKRAPEPEREQAKRETPQKQSVRRPPATRPDRPAPETPQVAVPPPRAPPPAMIVLSPSQMASADISRRPSTAPPAVGRPMMGPADTRPAQPDSQRVGSAPNGEPLYAASWYREPYHEELDGYLSTATGPGWGLIACRTAPEFRVEDCVKIDEYPTGSNIARAVLAAAWQFRVRPPRIGGQPKIGEWVRIRIDYGIKPRQP